MKLKIVLLLIALNVTAIGWSQDARAILNERIKTCAKKYEAETTFSASLYYKMYSGYNVAKPEEAYDGLFCKSGVNNYLRMHTVEVLNINDLVFQIQNDDQSILIVKGGGKVQENPFSMAQYLSQYKTVTRKSKGNIEQFELIAPKVSQLAFSKIIIHIKDKNEIAKQEFYFAGQANYVNGGEEKLISPKMIVSYANYKKRVPKEVFQLGTYVKKQNGKFIGTGKYKEYKVQYLAN